MANIFIYGSCVSRDAYEYHLKHHALLKYMARQSWISATSPPASVHINEEPLHDFHKRILKEDISSNLFPSLSENRDDIDLLLMDLIDERLGVLQMRDGGFITRSEELLDTNPQEALKQSTYLKFGSASFQKLWQQSALILKKHIDSLGLTHKTLIVITPWASQNDVGENVKTSYSRKAITKANRTLTAMADYAQNIGFLVARMPEKYAIADSKHHWGESPVHYHDAAMQWIAHKVEQTLIVNR